MAFKRGDRHLPTGLGKKKKKKKTRNWQSCQPHSAGRWQLTLAGPLFRHDLFAVSLKVHLPGRQAKALKPHGST